MKVRTKIILMSPILGWRNHRARVLAKKIRKWKDNNRYPSQWRIKYLIKHARKFLKIMKIKVEVKGYENIPKGTVLLTPNHASSFDPVILISALTNPSKVPSDFQYEPLFLAKEELKKNRYRGYLNMINSFYIKRNNPREALKTLDEYLDFAKKNQKVAIVFPEGTRSKNGEINEFKSGGFRIAKKGLIPIVPVTINNSLSSSNLNRRKWLTVEVIFEKALKPIDFMALDNKAIAEKVKTIILRNFKKPTGIRSNNEDQV